MKLTAAAVWDVFLSFVFPRKYSWIFMDFSYCGSFSFKIIYFQLYEVRQQNFKISIIST